MHFPTQTATNLIPFAAQSVQIKIKKKRSRCILEEIGNKSLKRIPTNLRKLDSAFKMLIKKS